MSSHITWSLYPFLYFSGVFNVKGRRVFRGAAGGGHKLYNMNSTFPILKMSVSKENVEGLFYQST